MSFASRFLRRNPLKRSRSVAARNTGSAIQAYSPKRKTAINNNLDNDLTDKWLSRLRVSSHTYNASENYMQLNSLIDLFNRDTKNKGLKVKL
jgi:hypothetical protein